MKLIRVPYFIQRFFFTIIGGFLFLPFGRDMLLTEKDFKLIFLFYMMFSTMCGD